MEEFTHEFFENASREWRRNKEEVRGSPGVYRYKDVTMNRVIVPIGNPIQTENENKKETTLGPSLRRSQRIAQRVSNSNQ